jgi:large subunit ribosomal protein L10
VRSSFASAEEDFYFKYLLRYKMKESILAKQEEVKLVSEKMKNSAAFGVFKYQRLTVKAFQTLRRELRASGVEVSVIKNNISTRAAKENGYDAVTDAFSGPVAVAFAKDDVVAPAKILFAAKKEEETSNLEVVKGVVDGDVYSFEQLQ